MYPVYAQRVHVFQGDNAFLDGHAVFRQCNAADVKTEDVFRAIGIDYLNAKQIDENTVLLRPDEIALLKENAPYLIAMKVRDLREVPSEESVASDPRIVQIPAPQQEPIVGVIDTPFSKDVYFKDWVSYESSVLSQRSASKQTGAAMEDIASRVLQSNKYSDETKSFAASVLSQSNVER